MKYQRYKDWTGEHIVPEAENEQDQCVLERRAATHINSELIFLFLLSNCIWATIVVVALVSGG